MPLVNSTTYVSCFCLYRRIYATRFWKHKSFQYHYVIEGSYLGHIYDLVLNKCYICILSDNVLLSSPTKLMPCLLKWSLYKGAQRNIHLQVISGMGVSLVINKYTLLLGKNQKKDHRKIHAVPGYMCSTYHFNKGVIVKLSHLTHFRPFSTWWGLVSFPLRR